MKQVIGFATQFYTLWTCETSPNYKTDAYGNHHYIGETRCFNYIKNISLDLEKVKNIYPNVEIDEDLKGKTNSFSIFKKHDLPENFFWAGRYAGRLIDEILVSDFKYCLWSVENFGGKSSQYIQNHSTYLAYVEAQETARQIRIKNAQTVKIGDVFELEFTRNGYNADENYKGCMTQARFGETEIIILCDGVKLVEGIYPYLMPMINGKVQKTKGKKIKVRVLEVISTDVYSESVRQHIKVA